MKYSRIIPLLQIKSGSLVKTVQFKNPVYIGDPVNAIRIFNEKEVDELIILDITATQEHREPNYNLIRDIAGECFMPLCYGGGITSIDQIKTIFNSGVEKISINTSAFTNPSLIEKAASMFGSQSIVVSVDIRKNLLGSLTVFVDGGKKNTGMNPVKYAKEMENRGAGEILLNLINQEGTFKGFDRKLIKEVSDAVNIPVIASGGAANVEDLCGTLIETGVSAVAAGSLFVYNSRIRGILINYPDKSRIREETAKQSSPK